MKILKGIGKFFGGLFILLGIAIFLMGCFGVNAVNNVDLIEVDLFDENGVGNFVDNYEDEINQIEEYCNLNPNDNNCDILSDSTIMAVLDDNAENPILDTIKGEISDYAAYGSTIKWFGVIFFIVGFLLLMLCSGWLIGLRNGCLISFIGILLAFFYFKFIIPGALTSFLPLEVLNIINNWVVATINKTLNLVIALMVTFLILTIALYILVRKKMKLLGKASAKESKK